MFFCCDLGLPTQKDHKNLAVKCTLRYVPHHHQQHHTNSRQPKDKANMAQDFLKPIHQLVLVGDSDIAFWPEDLLPLVAPDLQAHMEEPLVSGHPGASLGDVLPKLKKTLKQAKQDSWVAQAFKLEKLKRAKLDVEEKLEGLKEADDFHYELVFNVPPLMAKKHQLSTIESNLKSKKEKKQLVSPPNDPFCMTLFVVFCAGENDIGEGLSLDKSVHSLWQLLDVVFDDKYRFKSERTGRTKVVLIFLGPKFEPWLDDDPSSKQDYVNMSRAFERRIKEHQKELDNSESEDKVHFVDCLTMFCGESAKVPGARIGGRARAEVEYFAADRLHLSRSGYQVWKEKVEAIMRDESGN